MTWLTVTGSATMPGSFSALTRSTKAWGKVRSLPWRMPIFFMGRGASGGSGFEEGEILRKHVAPVVPVVAAPFAVVEKMRDALGGENGGKLEVVRAAAVAVAGAKDNAHLAQLVEHHGVGQAREVIDRIVKI